jgi:outer membrane receptor protein involved in Fe transport
MFPNKTSTARHFQNQPVALKALVLAGVSTFIMGAFLPAAAQSASKAAGSAPEEIIVTARKREESIMKTPVVLQAISKQQVEDLHLTNIESLTSDVPGLKIAYQYSLAGISATLRGIGNGGQNTYGDQSVALNVDGMTFSSGLLYRQSMFDVAQIEVLKGPQALFFGKSTTAGLIAIHTADPTKQWDTQVQVGYEFNADELDLNGYVSGPVTDDLGIRLAGYHNTMKGYFDNPNSANPAQRVPGETDNGFRGTIKYDNPDVGLRIKLKGGATDDEKNTDFTGLLQTICATGINPIAIYTPYDDCKVDKTTQGEPGALPYGANTDFSFGSPAFATNTPDPIFRDGKSYGYVKTALGILSVDYDLAQGLTASSVTGLSWGKAADAGQQGLAGVPSLDIGIDGKVQDISEELRLTSNWKDRWYNFMIGGLYSSSARRTHLVLSIPVPGLFSDNRERMESENDSVFGQVLLTPIPKFELSAGLRYTHVNKTFVSLIAANNYPAFLTGGVALPTGESIQFFPNGAASASQNATTPEFTLTYRPTDDLTAFVSYKRGYKALGWNSLPTTPSYTIPGSISPFGGEKTKGVEGGVKAQLLDHQLAVTATGYLYDYDALQVSFVDLSTATAKINNGANARVQGFELAADYSPESVPGLTVNAFVNYNDAHYTSFPSAGCYGGQTLAQGCLGTGIVGQIGYQNLAGRPLNGAPKWSGNLGATYKKELNDRYTGTIQAQLQYSGSYFIGPEDNPAALQHHYALLDVALHLARSDNSWDIALLCRDCTNKYYSVYGTDAGVTTTGTPVGTQVIVNRPRQIVLQLTMHPNLF